MPNKYENANIYSTKYDVGKVLPILSQLNAALSAFLSVFVFYGALTICELFAPFKSITSLAASLRQED